MNEAAPGTHERRRQANTRNPPMAEVTRKILCIEDDRETAALIAEELVDRGYAVTVAHDGREGLAAILKTMPDLVLSDMSMPLKAPPKYVIVCGLARPSEYLRACHPNLVPS